jgi:hypothetical protein
VRRNLPVLLSAAALLFITTIHDVNFLNYSSPIAFSRINTITFKDFKGLAKPGTSLDGMTELAFISTNREIILADTFAEVTSYFHPSRSYIFKQDLRSEELLRHELYHFRITEYYTRLVRASIINLKTRPTRKQIRDIDSRYSGLERNTQLQYDQETYHVYVLGVQKRWELKLDAQLSSLNNLSGTIVNFPNNH